MFLDKFKVHLFKKEIFSTDTHKSGVYETNLIRSSGITYHQTERDYRPGDLRRENECKCEERRTMLIRNQESGLHVVDFDSIMLLSLIPSRKRTLSVGE